MNSKLDPQNANDPATLPDWLVDRVAQHALRTILEENRRVHILEDRIARLERRVHDLGGDPQCV